MANLEKAIRIAAKAHKGQTDKYDEPYLLHVLRVMGAGQTDEERIAGALHDVVEDSEWTYEDLRREGFSERIIAAVECLTKRGDDEDYNLFIDRIRKNPL